MKTAAPIAKGVAIKADKIVTIKEPKIIGRAPNSFPDGFQVVPNRKLKIFTPLLKKVDNPFCATKINIMATITTIKDKHAKVSHFPNFSKREFFEGESNFLANSSFLIGFLPQSC
ncbi:hypothetical protein STRDD10_00367 [Streptococcus sp. DD10]|nr:hypothetical protein STRDD10_00367 [Streptococcus sp. DD10]